MSSCNTRGEEGFIILVLEATGLVTEKNSCRQQERIIPVEGVALHHGPTSAKYRPDRAEHVARGLTLCLMCLAHVGVHVAPFCRAIIRLNACSPAAFDLVSSIVCLSSSNSSLHDQVRVVINKHLTHHLYDHVLHTVSLYFLALAGHSPKRIA